MSQIGAYWIVNFKYVTGLCIRDRIILNLLQNLFTGWIQRVNIIISSTVMKLTTKIFLLFKRNSLPTLNWIDSYFFFSH